jgi:hypothetical protein
MVVSDVPHLHILTDWGINSRSCVEDVQSFHLPECRVITRAHYGIESVVNKPLMRTQAPQIQPGCTTAST